MAGKKELTDEQRKLLEQAVEAMAIALNRQANRQTVPAAKEALKAHAAEYVQLRAILPML